MCVHAGGWGARSWGTSHPSAQPGLPSSHLMTAAGGGGQAGEPWALALPPPRVVPLAGRLCGPFRPVVPVRLHRMRVAATAAACPFARQCRQPARSHRGAGRSEALWAFFGPVYRGAPEPARGGQSAWPPSKGMRPVGQQLFRAQGWFPHPLPKEEGNVDAPPHRRQRGSLRPQKGWRGLGQRGQFGPSSLLFTAERVGFSPGSFKAPCVTTCPNLWGAGPLLGHAN